jgi:ketosteroid isomerase-like protein
MSQVSAAVDAEIDTLYRAWSDAFARADVDAIIALLTPDYLLFAPGAPPMTASELRPRITSAVAAWRLTPQFEREERLVSGSLAFERGWDVQRLEPIAGGDAVVQRQRVFLILQRGDDGVWRFARGMAQPGPAN